MPTLPLPMFRHALAAAALSLLAIGQSQAALVTFADRTSFTSAAGSLSNIDFEAQATNTGSFTYYGGGLTIGGVGFTAPLSNYLWVAAANAVGNSYQWGSGASLLFGSTNEGGNLVITLGAGVFSFGFDLMAESDSQPDSTGGLIYSISVDGIPYSTATSGRPTRSFFGITSDTAISSLTLTMTNTNNHRSLPIIDNVSYGGAATRVPEPGSLMLVALALAGLGAARRRAP